MNVMIGFDVVDSSGRKIDMYGCPQGAPYSYMMRVNPWLPASGSTTLTGNHYTWSLKNLPANAASSYIEVYPNNQYLQTDKSRYGMSMRTRVPVGSTWVSLRMPLICSQGGHTGGIQGYVTKGGVKVTPSYAIAWSQAADSNAYIMGMGIGTLSNGFYKIDALAYNQKYVMRVMYNGVTVQRTLVPVYACKYTPVSIGF